MTNVEEILHYWFGDHLDDSRVLNQKGKLWFGKDSLVDCEIKSRFGGLIEHAERYGTLPGEDPPLQRSLATILLLDQFTRNVYRGTPRAFASDSIALQLSLDLLREGNDKDLRPIERVFVYLPLEHSEDLIWQNRSVELFEGLVSSVSEQCTPAFEDFLDYAIRHQEIIAKFGRFPHRNQILGRISTAEEVEFLTQPNSSF